MNSRTHLTIVCLKNQKPHQPFHQSSGIILSGLSNSQISSQERIVPSLAYLSARLQFNQHEPVPSTLQQHKQLMSQRTLEMTETQSFQVGEQSHPKVEQYVEDQKHLVDTKKNTIRNMMGSIDFSLDRKRQRKVARTIQQTIGRLAGTHRVRTTKKKDTISIEKDQDIVLGIQSEKKKKQLRRQRKRQKQMSQLITRQPCSPQNRTFLEQDFKIFLNNQKKRPDFLPKVDQTEAIKLKRLAVVNPEQNQISGAKGASRLDLFRFQLKNPNNSDRHHYTSTSSDFASSHAAIARDRLEKKMFKMALNMGDDEEFDWTKVPSKPAFDLSRIG